MGMVLAPFFLKERTVAHQLRVIAFALLTPIYFLKAGSLVKFDTLVAAAGLIGMFLAVKMATKFVGIWPLTRAFRFAQREGMYTTLMMSTGLTFGTISALFGLTNGIIDQDQYTVLVTVCDSSAVVPTLDRAKMVPTVVQRDRAGGPEDGGAGECLTRSCTPTTAPTERVQGARGCAQPGAPLATVRAAHVVRGRDALAAWHGRRCSATRSSPITGSTP